MAIDFKTGLTIAGVAVRAGYPALSGLVAGQVLRASNGTTVAFATLQASDLPANVAYKNSDNQFSVAQGFGGAAATLANWLYAAPVNGSTLPLIKAGNQSSAMAGQIAISGLSLNTNAVQGDSYAEAGVAGFGRGDYGVGLHGEVSYNYTTNVRTVARLRHTSSQTTVAGFGAGLNFEATRGAPPTYDIMATIAALWTTPGSTLADLTFSVAGGFLPVERMRLTSAGYLGLNTASPVGDLHLNIRDQEQVFRGLTIGGVTGTYAPGLIFRRSDGSYTTPSATSNNVELGRISFYAYTASGWSESSYIRAVNVTGGEAASNLVFAQDTGTQWVDTLTLTLGKVGVRNSSPNFTFEPKMLDIYPAVNIAEASTIARRATIGFGLNAAITTGWIMGQGYNNATVKDFYLLDATASAIRLYIDTSGSVGIGTGTTPGAKLDVMDGYIRAKSGTNTAPASGTGLEMVYTGGIGYLLSYDRTNSAFQAMRLGGSTVTFYGPLTSQPSVTGGQAQSVQVGINSISTGAALYITSPHNNNVTDIAQFMAQNVTQGIGISYNTIAQIGSNTTGDININPKSSTGKLIVGGSGNIYPGAQSTYYFGLWGGSGINVYNHLLVQGNVYPGGQGTYHLDYTASPAGLIVNGNLSSYHDIFPGNNNGTGGSQNASYYLRGETNSGGIRTNGALLASGALSAGTYLQASGALGTNHLVALCASGLYTLVFSGLGGYSYTSGGIGYNFGNTGAGSSGQITGSNGGGFIRWHQDGQIHIASMNTSGTVGIVFYAGLNNVGIGVQQGTNNRLFTKGIDSTSSNNAFLAQNSNGSNLFYLRNDGLAWVNQNWTVGSDARMKRGVRSMGPSHRKLHQLRAVEYELTHTGTARKHYGLLAEEVEQIYPDLIEESHNNEPGAEALKGVRYGDLIPLLIYEIQQLQIEVAALKKGNAK